MANLSIRGIDPETAELLKRVARQRGVSVNTQVIELVHQGLGIGGGGRRKRYTDLDHLAGTWSPEEGKQMEESLADFAAVDENLWR
jgi:hypothetical protein